MSRVSSWRLFALLMIGLSLSACQREQAPVSAPGDPVGAVRAQVAALHDNDLVRYYELSLPPVLREKTEARWARRIAQAEPVSDEDRAEFDRLLQRFTAKDAETELQKTFDARMKKLESEIAGQWPMLQATATIFLKAAVDNNDTLDSDEKSHANTAIATVVDWAKPALFTDRERAHRAIVELTGTARALKLTTLDETRTLALRPMLEKGSIVMAGLKRIGQIYGFDADASLAATQAELVSGDHDQAVVKVSYPLFGKTVTFPMTLVRRDGRWYNANAVARAEADDDVDAAPAPRPDLDQADPEPADASNAE